MTFDAADPGTAADVWRADPRFSELPPLPLDAFASAIVLAAHADDETLGAGGLIALLRARNVDVTVIVATDGAAEGVEARAVRAAEVRQAAALLGVSRRPLLLGHHDGRVREERAEITRDLVSIVGVPRPGTVLVAPWRGDGHRDHRVLGEIAVSVAAAAGLALWEYPVWLWHWGDPGHPDVPWRSLERLPLDVPSRTAKRLALDAYVSQTRGSDGRQPMLHARFLENFAGPDEFFVVTRPPEGGAPAIPG